MPDFDFDIGIIGAGAAGLTVAAGAAQFGAKTLLVERDQELGGDCLHYGCVLSNAVLRLPRRVDYRNFPWCTYTDPELAGIGMNEKMAVSAGIPYRVWTEEFRSNDRAVTANEAKGKIKMLTDRRGKPIGVQILGTGGGELISEWVAIMKGGVSLSSIASAIHPYPTLGEINKRVAGKPYAEKLFSEKVRKALKFLFSLKGRACD